MADKRTPLSRRRPRAFFRVRVAGAQPGALVVPITGSMAFNYDSPGKVDPGADISQFYSTFAFQSEDNGANSVNAQIQLNLVGGDDNWVTPEVSYISDPVTELNLGQIAPSDLIFMELPTPGVQVRLLVDMPGAGTDFSIQILMTNSSERRSLDNA